MRGRGGWKYALEKFGELCVIIVGAPVMLVWCAGSWDLKWTVEHVRSSQNSIRLQHCMTYINLHRIQPNTTQLIPHKTNQPVQPKKFNIAPIIAVHVLANY